MIHRALTQPAGGTLNSILLYLSATFNPSYVEDHTIHLRWQHQFSWRPIRMPSNWLTHPVNVVLAFRQFFEAVQPCNKTACAVDTIAVVHSETVSCDRRLGSLLL
jgi:hypothetical protein